jgi:hypothetical protein
MEMSTGKLDSASGMTLLRDVVRRPLDYGLDHRHPSLTNVLAFARRNAECMRDSEASARRKIERCRAKSRPRRANAAPAERPLRHQLLEVKQDLAWAELDHRLGIGRRDWNADRYARLANGLCVLAALWRHRRRHFPQASPYASRAAAARLARLWQLKERGWEALQDHLHRSGLDWHAGIAAHLNGARHALRDEPGATRKRVRGDRNGNAWMIKYSPESLVNPVLASLFARLSGCPGAEICPSFLDYDWRHRQPCSVQPYVRVGAVSRLDVLPEDILISLIGGDRRRASQILCQAVAQWILENIDGNQVIVDEFGNCVWIDHDRSFFIDDHRVTTDWRAAWVARNKAGVSVVPAQVIAATARIPGVMEDLAAFVGRVEAIPAAAYEGLVRNASFREEQLCSLFYLDAMGPDALASIKALERWIAHLLARKATVRSALARRLRDVLGSVECRL